MAEEKDSKKAEVINSEPLIGSLGCKSKGGNESGRNGTGKDGGNIGELDGVEGSVLSCCWGGVKEGRMKGRKEGRKEGRRQ